MQVYWSDREEAWIHGPKLEHLAKGERVAPGRVFARDAQP